jgi:TPR repeat protein
MDESRQPQPPKTSGAPMVGSRWMLPRIPVLIGIAGLGAVVTTGSWFKREANLRQRAEAQAIAAEVADLRSQATQYHERMANLQWNAGKIRAAADAHGTESVKSWLRERARKFDEFVARVDQAEEGSAFTRISGEIDELCRRGEMARARQATMQLRPPKFPSAEEFSDLQHEFYFTPLASFSRSNPAYYVAFQTYEADAARNDLGRLRAELAATDLDVITPQSLVMFELFSAIAPPDDPLLADWTSAASAADYFENPDSTTLKQWREATQAMRRNDWPTAFARMQSISLTTVRTRQPFRAAFGRAILKNRPDDTAEAYPFMHEAAIAGDAEARAWMAREEMAQGRFSAAVGWLEASIAAGDLTAASQLVDLYTKDRQAVPRDVAREAGFLQKILASPDAPPLGLILMGRLYEDGEGVPQSHEKAFACYQEAAGRSLVAGWTNTARCHLRGTGTPKDLDLARAWALRAYTSGERAESVPILIELMDESPDRTAGAVQALFAQEQTASPSGFRDTRLQGPGVAKLRMQVAKYLDQHGSFSAAARLYAQTGADDANAAHRHAELTTVHACDVCAGLGKIQSATACPTCVGKGTVTCGICDGRGFNLIPGSPPCTTCGGSGGMIQDGRRVGCAACGGNGKGKGSVIKQSCGHCAHGRAPCRECTGGWIKLTKECPECRGVGSRALADK